STSSRQSSPTAAACATSQPPEAPRRPSAGRPPLTPVRSSCARRASRPRFALDTIRRGAYSPPPQVVTHLLGGLMGSRTRILLTFVLALALAAVVGAPAASPSLTYAVNAKHFFWAPGQNPQGTVADSAANDLVYHGGNVGDGAIGVETTPAVYLVFWG